MPVKACLTIANFNNPPGSRMPENAKRELVRILAGRNIPLIENDIFGEIHFNAHRPPAAIQRLGKMVVQTSAFSS
jgi:DNA-binding transcriptional MocR family regulator